MATHLMSIWPAEKICPGIGSHSRHIIQTGQRLNTNYSGHSLKYQISAKSANQCTRHFEVPTCVEDVEGLILYAAKEIVSLFVESKIRLIQAESEQHFLCSPRDSPP